MDFNIFRENTDPFGNNIKNPLSRLLSSDELASIYANDQINYKNNTLPDSTGVDFFFLFNFINHEMANDFPQIEYDFLKHCANKLTAFSNVGWYDDDSFAYNNVRYSSKEKILRLIYNGAKLHDSYCLSLINYLYKIYYKDEYRLLKRFSIISFLEVYDISKNNNVNGSDFFRKQ